MNFSYNLGDMIYISTGGFSNINPTDVIDDYLRIGLSHVELSAGKYCPDIETRLEAYRDHCTFILHNYFPVPEVPFVLNLASLNDEVFTTSCDHVRSAIGIASRLQSRYYSFHAGFLLDPKPTELGQSIGRQAFFDRDRSIERFVNATNSLAEFASKLNVQLLVENNVCSPRNLNQFNANPFLLSDPSGVKELFQHLDSNILMLLDVAHLKVSANTLGYDTAMFIAECHELVGGYHLSDNCGTVDSHQPFDDGSYFWEFLKTNLDYYSVEVHGCTPVQLLQQANLVRSKLQT